MADPRLDKKFLSSSQRANRRVLFGSGGRQEDRGVTTSTSHSPPPSSSQTTTCTSIHLQHHQHYVSTSISRPNASTSLPARNPASSSVRSPVPFPVRRVRNVRSVGRRAGSRARVRAINPAVTNTSGAPATTRQNVKTTFKRVIGRAFHVPRA